MSNKVDYFQVAGSNVEVPVIVGKEDMPRSQRISGYVTSMALLPRSAAEGLMMPYSAEDLEVNGKLLGETFNGTYRLFECRGFTFTVCRKPYNVGGYVLYRGRETFDLHQKVWDTNYVFTKDDYERIKASKVGEFEH